jgi:hypothetical protein
MLAIWSAVAYTSVETGGLSSGGGLIGSAIAYAQWNDCVDLVSADFANCMGTVS